MTYETPGLPLMPPFRLLIDCAEPMPIPSVRDGIIIAMNILAAAPSNTSAVILDAQGHTWSFKIDDTLKVVDVPF